MYMTSAHETHPPSDQAQPMGQLVCALPPAKACAGQSLERGLFQDSCMQMNASHCSTHDTPPPQMAYGTSLSLAAEPEMMQFVGMSYHFTNSPPHCGPPENNSSRHRRAANSLTSAANPTREGMRRAGSNRFLEFLVDPREEHLRMRFLQTAGVDTPKKTKKDTVTTFFWGLVFSEATKMCFS